MAVVTGCTTYGLEPNLGRKTLLVVTPSTADSGDTIDVSSNTVTGGEVLASIDFVMCFDQTGNDIVTATVSTTTITLDTGGSTTDHAYAVYIVGK
jgi:hypothetical protein